MGWFDSSYKIHQFGGFYWVAKIESYRQFKASLYNYLIVWSNDKVLQKQHS